MVGKFLFIGNLFHNVLDYSVIILRSEQFKWFFFLSCSKEDKLSRQLEPTCSLSLPDGPGGHFLSKMQLNSMFNMASLLTYKDQTSNSCCHLGDIVLMFLKILESQIRVSESYLRDAPISISPYRWEHNWTEPERGGVILYFVFFFFLRFWLIYSMSHAWGLFDLESSPNWVTVSVLWETPLGNLLGTFLS